MVNPDKIRNKRQEWIRVEGKCHYCGNIMTLSNKNKPHKPTDASWDHVIPKVRNGSNGRHNLVLCCKHCNERKGGMSYDDAIRCKPWEMTKTQYTLLKKQIYCAMSGNINALNSMLGFCPLCEDRIIPG